MSFDIETLHSAPTVLLEEQIVLLRLAERRVPEWVTTGEDHAEYLADLLAEIATITEEIERRDAGQAHSATATATVIDFTSRKVVL